MNRNTGLEVVLHPQALHQRNDLYDPQTRQYEFKCKRTGTAVSFVHSSSCSNHPPTFVYVCKHFACNLNLFNSRSAIWTDRTFYFYWFRRIFVATHTNQRASQYRQLNWIPNATHFHRIIAWIKFHSSVGKNEFANTSWTFLDKLDSMEEHKSFSFSILWFLFAWASIRLRILKALTLALHVKLNSFRCDAPSHSHRHMHQYRARAHRCADEAAVWRHIMHV